MKAEKYIEIKSYTSFPNSPEIIEVKDALKAAEMAREEMKAKAIEALDSVLDRWVHGGDADYILEEFKIKLEDKQ